MPNRCVLNGLEVELIPAELENLDPLSKQASQAAFRLGTYTGKVPSAQCALILASPTVFSLHPLITLFIYLYKKKPDYYYAFMTLSANNYYVCVCHVHALGQIAIVMTN